MLQIRDEDGLYNEPSTGSDPRLTQGLATHNRLIAANRDLTNNGNGSLSVMFLDPGAAPMCASERL